MEIIKDLHNSQLRTLAFFEMPEAALELQYAPGKWNVRQILCHLADAETVLYDRVRRIISEPRQVIWAFDQDLWCDALDYHTFPLQTSRAIFENVRNGVIHLAQQHYKSLGDKEFVHSETGVRTLKDEFNKIAWHNAHHLEQINQALGN